MKQVHPVEDIGISPWPVDVVEFGADVYAHWKQVGIRQLYNQVPQTAWVSSNSSCSWSQLGTKCQSENQLADRRLAALSDPQLSSPARTRKKCCYGQNNFWSICSSLSPSPTHLSHTTNINPFENKVCDVYLYKEVCSFIHWSSSVYLIMFRIYLYYVYVYV